jgi:hypothetical protein
MQARPYRALVKALVLMDLRSQQYGRATGTKPGELIPPLYWVLGQFLFISAVASALLFARVSVEAFAFVNLSLSTVLAVAAVLVEFNEVVLDVGDIDIVGHRPISRRTYAAARLTNLAFYMALIVVALNVFPAIMGAGLQDSSLMFLPAYALVSVLGSSGAVLLAIVACSFAPPRRDQQDFRDLLAWSQIVVALAVFYGAQLMLRDSEHAIEMFFAEPPPWLAWVPTAWLASFVAAVAQAPTLQHLRWSAGAVCGVGLLALLAWLRLMTYYSRAQLASAAAQPPRRRFGRSRPLIGPLVRLMAGPGHGAGVLASCFLLLRRDRELRLRTWPALATVFAFLAIGLLLEELADPFGGQPGRGFSVVVVQLAVLAVPTIIHNLSYSRDHAATWLFHAAPQPRRSIYAEAARRAACYGILLPALLGLWLVFAVAWRDPLHATVHCAIGWLTVVLASHVTLWGMEYPLPFAQPVARGVVTGPVLPYLAGVGTVAAAIGSAEYLAARSWPAVGGLVLILLALVLLSSRLPRFAPDTVGPTDA